MLFILTLTTSVWGTEHMKTSKGEVPWTAFRSQAFFAGLIEVCRDRRRAILPLTFQLDNCCRRVKYVQEYAYSLHVIVSPFVSTPELVLSL